VKITGIEEEVQAKGIRNIFNKVTENPSHLEKILPIQVQKALKI
jgi:2-oxoglutarate dehydrogenase complex dehydrogenase (E1) component-like enzyme